MFDCISCQTDNPWRCFNRLSACPVCLVAGGAGGCWQEVWRASRGVASEVGVSLALLEGAFEGGSIESPILESPCRWHRLSKGVPLRFAPSPLRFAYFPPGLPGNGPMWSDTANKHSLKAFTRRPHFV